jgi:predicted O-methyltransferase YrrM
MPSCTRPTRWPTTSPRSSPPDGRRARRAIIEGVNAERRAIADQLLRTAREHDAAKDDAERLHVVEPETGALLGILVRATAARRIIEFGTSVGHATLWLADGARDSGGHFSTVEIDAQRSAWAKESLDRAGLSADLRVSDAGAVLSAAPDDSWDLVFLDADRSAYGGYWPDLLRTLRPHGGLLIVAGATELADLEALIDAEPRVTSTVAPVGGGLLLVTRGSEL